VGCPPFCPNAECRYHGDARGWGYKKKGFYSRQARPRRVQRYVCTHCDRQFSSQTFSVGYWLKRPELLGPLFYRVLGCSGFRQIAREFGVAPTTVMRQAARLGRHCLLFHEGTRPGGPLQEPLVLDGFRTFEFGQYWPYETNLAVGRSHFVYGFDDAELRRSGTMTPEQRRKRARLEARLGRADPRATERSVRALLARVIPRGSRAEVRSDEHRAYPRALAALEAREIVHRTTSSRAPRTSHNPLFPVNLADLLIRHSSANHKRETIAFSKRRQSAAYRMAIWLVWRNYIKSVSERRQNATPAQRLGILRARLGLPQLLHRRLFPSHFRLPPDLERCYFGRIPTRRIPNGVEHRCRYAI